MHKKKLLFKLKQIAAGFNCVPKDIPINEDPGIYYRKAMRDLTTLIKLMEEE